MNTRHDIAVCGAGTMGSGIAQVCAQHGLRIVLFDHALPQLVHAREKIGADLELLVSKQKISPADARQTLASIHFSNNLEDCVAGIIIEAVVEDLQVKTDLLNRVSAFNLPDTVLATNTSSLPVTAIAETLQRPQQLGGMHFFNPAPLMKLVEIVRTDHSSADTINRLTALASQIGKTAVQCSDTPGFIVNHVARPFYLEPLWLLEQESVDLKIIDRLIEATGFRMGPFALMDLIGNDINFSVSSIVYQSFHRPARLKPSFIQEQKVKQGLLGRKTGRGYYEYPAK